MTFLETEMKELGRSIWNDTQHSIVDPYLSSMSQTSRSRKKHSRWKSIKTHTRTHKQLFADFFEIAVLKNYGIFTGKTCVGVSFCEYGKIKLFCRIPLVAASVPCFFLKLLLKLFVHLYYLFHNLNKTLYLRCISNTCDFLILFLHFYQTSKYMLKLNN